MSTTIGDLHGESDALASLPLDVENMKSLLHNAALFAQASGDNPHIDRVYDLIMEALATIDDHEQSAKGAQTRVGLDF